MPDALTATTTCNLCKKSFEAERIPIIGEDVQSKSTRLMNRLVEHLAQKHPAHMGEIFRASQQYTAMLTLQSFTLTDPALLDAMEKGREFANACLNPKPVTAS